MRRLLITSFVLATLPVLASAQNFKAVNHLTVIPLGNSSFEVIEARGEGPRGIWCAAAQYAERRLGVQGRIYVQKARGSSVTLAGRKSVMFTTNKNKLSQGPSRSLSVSTSRVGAGLPVPHAIQFCSDVFDERDNVWERN